MPATAPFVTLPLVSGGSAQVQTASVAAIVQDPANAARSFVTSTGGTVYDPLHIALSADDVSLALAGGTTAGAVGTVLGAVTGTGAGATSFATPGLTFSRTGVGNYLIAIDDAQAAAGVCLVTLGLAAGSVGSTVLASQAAPGPTVGNWTIETYDSAGLAFDPAQLNAAVIRTA